MSVSVVRPPVAMYFYIRFFCWYPILARKHRCPCAGTTQPSLTHRSPPTQAHSISSPDHANRALLMDRPGISILSTSDRDRPVPKQCINRLGCSQRRHSDLRSCAAFAAPPIPTDPDHSMMDTSISASPYFQVYATLGWTSVHELALPLFASALAASDWRSAAPHVLS